MIIIKCYRNEKIKSRRTKGHLGNMTAMDTFKHLSKYPLEDFKFIDTEKRDVTETELMLLIKRLEELSTAPQDVNLSRIIRAGGFIRYVKQLERSGDETSNYSTAFN